MIETFCAKPPVDPLAGFVCGDFVYLTEVDGDEYMGYIDCMCDEDGDLCIVCGDGRLMDTYYIPIKDIVKITRIKMFDAPTVRVRVGSGSYIAPI